MTSRTSLLPRRYAVSLVALGTAAALLPTALPSARADVPPPPPTAVTLAPGGIPPSAQESNGYDFTAHGEALASVATQKVAPGLALTNYQRLEAGGWNRGNVLTADLSEPTLRLDVHNTGAVAGVGTLSSQMAGTGAVAGINGDFFDINASGAPVGIAKSSAGVLNTVSGTRPAFTLAGGKAMVAALTSSGTLTADGTATPLAGFNTPSLPTNGIGVYTGQWGDVSLDRPVGGPGSISPKVARATVVGGVVTAVGHGAGAPAVPAGGQVLLGRETGADVVGGLTVGEHVDVEVGLSRDVDLALSGADQLVADGAVNPAVSDDGLHSRTAIGVSRDGQKVIALTVDGMTTASVGMRRSELATLMQSLGAWEAINLDGGGSSTMAARIAGTSTPVVVNTPQDGAEREVSNSLLFFSSAKPQGRPVTAQVRPLGTRAGDYTVLQGQSRTLFGSGVDAAYAGVEHAGRFSTTGGRVAVGALRGATSVATGLRRGPTTVRFDAGAGRTASMPLTVLGPLDHVTADRATIPFADRSSGAASVRLTGYDVDGNPSPVEPRDVRVTADPGVVVTPDGADGFTLTPATDKGTAVVRFQVGDHFVETTVLVGLDEQTVAGFADGASWTKASDRATGTLSTTTGPEGQPALRLQYDFTQSTATRGMYAVPPAALPVTGQPLDLTMWVKGDGSGVWPRIQVTSANGTVSNLDGDLVTWEGWQQVTFPVPAGTAMPLTVNRIRFLEVRSDASYQGDVSFTDLVAHIAPATAPVDVEPVHDPVIVTDGTVDARPQRIAVISDGQFVARDPDSALVASVRQTLRQIVAAKPDYLVIDGDFVDEASTADIAFAKQVLDEEVGDAVPWTYVPGNHEVMGSPIDNFKAVFGATHTTRLLSTPTGSTRLITLNSSSLTLHGNDDGRAQLTELEQQLREAATDPAVTGVLVATHVPVDDPLSDKASQLGDRVEAQALADRLGRFRTQSGKSVAVVNGHVGVFHASSNQGVSMIVNGNSGKTPAGNVTDGGFRGWTMLGIDPAKGVVGRVPRATARTDWLQAETHPAVDAVHLDVPAALGVGSTVTLAPTFTQGTATVPVAWPVSADWSGTGVAFGEKGAGVVRYDPATGRLTALHRGTATLTVTVGGVTASATVVVTAG